jgi:hypothetical protein
MFARRREMQSVKVRVNCIGFFFVRFVVCRSYDTRGSQALPLLCTREEPSTSAAHTDEEET